MWLWLKKNWKWLLLPLWFASLVLVWLFRGGDRTLFPVTGTTDKDADEALKAQQEAAAAFRARLDELAAKADKKLQTASKEQLQEYETMKGKSLDEVAKWIDELS